MGTQLLIKLLLGGSALLERIGGEKTKSRSAEELTGFVQTPSEFWLSPEILSATETGVMQTLLSDFLRGVSSLPIGTNGHMNLELASLLVRTGAATDFSTIRQCYETKWGALPQISFRIPINTTFMRMWRTPLNGSSMRASTMANIVWRKDGDNILLADRWLSVL